MGHRVSPAALRRVRHNRGRHRRQHHGPDRGGRAALNRELPVVSIGAGLLIASHVNDGGFWLVKEYFNMTVPETFATWTVLETVIAVAGLAAVLLLSAIVG